MVPYHKADKGILYYGDAFNISKSIQPNSIQCVVTSPPYWGLRSYFNSDENQLGLEKTPELYIHHLVEIFKGIRKVLHPTGTVWLNIDDTYCVPSTKREGELGMKPGVPAKNLIGIPWRVALALQADGWWLRCDNIWNKTNCHPEPVRDRPTRSHEYVFLLTKKSHYFYDKIAVYEKLQHGDHFAGDRSKVATESGGMFKGGHDQKRKLTGKNRRSVWNIPTDPTTDPHYAAFPSQLAALCIRAGTSLKGCCSKCGNPIKRIVEDKDKHHWTEKRGKGDKWAAGKVWGRNDGGGSYTNELTTVGWEPTCKCAAGTKPCTVLDPFAGRGTTLMTAEMLNRNWVGVEITKESCELAKQNLINRKSGLKPITKVPDGLFKGDEIDITLK